MRITSLCTFALALAFSVLGAQVADAQQAAPAPRISLTEAKTALEAAEAEARANGWNLAFVITDAEGTPILTSRMDGVPTRNYEVALNKINTALTSGMHTADYVAAVEAGRAEEIEGALPYPGGYLLRRGGQLLGAFSASGARGTEDAQAVEAGMTAIGIQP